MAAEALLGTAAARAEDIGAVVPGTINFLAWLVTVSEGVQTALSGVQHVLFSIYDAEKGGTLVWSRLFPVTCTTNGVFNLVLDDGGSIAGSPAEEKLVDAFQGTERWIELAVEDVGTLAPRMRVPTAPYAFQSQYALWGADGFCAGATMSVADDAEFEGAVAVSGQGAVSNLTVTAGGGTLGSLKADGTVSVPAGKPNEGGGTIPVGGIVAWWQEEIPDGWVLCDGNNDTPDLRGWFVMGAPDDASRDTTGGAASVTLSEVQIPPHTHGYVFPSGEGQGSVLGTDDDGHIWRHETGATTGSTGGGQAHENRPPYLALYYIMRAR
jgi:microcystin-dependent protein